MANSEQPRSENLERERVLQDNPEAAVAFEEIGLPVAELRETSLSVMKLFISNSVTVVQLIEVINNSNRLYCLPDLYTLPEGYLEQLLRCPDSLVQFKDAQVSLVALSQAAQTRETFLAMLRNPEPICQLKSFYGDGSDSEFTASLREIVGGTVVANWSLAVNEFMNKLTWRAQIEALTPTVTPTFDRRRDCGGDRVLGDIGLEHGLARTWKKSH